MPASDVPYTDEQLGEAVDVARKWIGGLRLSWPIVAANYLRTGRCSSAMPR